MYHLQRFVAHMAFLFLCIGTVVILLGCAVGSLWLVSAMTAPLGLVATIGGWLLWLVGWIAAVMTWASRSDDF